MIKLTRLNGKEFSLNALLIEQVEAFPDTTVSLINGKKIVVLDPVNDVMLKVNSVFQSIGLVGSTLERDTEDS